MPKKKRKKSIVPLLGIAAGLAIAVTAGWLISQKISSGNIAPSHPSSLQQNTQNSSVTTPIATTEIKPSDYTALSLPNEMKAMWISFLEWQKMDLSTETALRQHIAPVFDNCKNMGLNTVIVAVRPFGDALYPSQAFPWSSLITGTQGKDPSYDPLQVLIEEAHARDLRVEAWLNPYRVKNPASGIDSLSANNPATLHPDWVREVEGSIWYDPGLPEVQQLVTQGVQEIVENYNVDGIHLDDYFYPEFSAEQKEDGADTAFDASTFAQYGSGKTLADWRRDNVNTLVQSLHSVVKSVNNTVSFGISPQGNNENNYTMQYSDVKLWMANSGYVDYVMPQLYWGFNYQTSSGRDTYAFQNISHEWASYSRIDSVKLYAGLGAYRIGVGDGGANEQDEWESGHNLADMISHLRQQEKDFSGFALFRYEFLFDSTQPQAEAEKEALTALLAQ